MAENFFTGLTGAMQANARQRNNDDYIDLMRQRQLQSEMSGALADKRADAADQRANEEMVMRREAANRAQEESMRRIRALDFEQKEREATANRVNLFRTESADFAKQFWAPQAVLGPDGNPMLDKEGNPVTTKRDPNNYRDQFKFYEGLAAIGHKHNGVDPATYGKYLLDKKALEEQGKTQVFEDALRQNPDALKEVGGAIGLSGSIRVGTRVDKFGLPTMFFSGVGKDGKPVEVDALTAMGTFGAKATDPTSGARAQAVQRTTLAINQQNADAATTSAAARMVDARRPRGGGGGGGEVDDSVPLKGTPLQKEADKLADNLRADKPSFDRSFGLAPLDTVDEFSRDSQREIGVKLFREGVPDGRGGKIYPQTAADAQAMANRIFRHAEQNVISSTGFIKNKAGKYEVVPAGTAGALPFNAPGVPFQLRQQVRDSGVAARLNGKQ